MLLQIDLPYACGGIVVEGKLEKDEDLGFMKVTEAAPIFKWMIGKDLTYVTQWVKSKGGKVTGKFPLNPDTWHGVWGTNE